MDNVKTAQESYLLGYKQYSSEGFIGGAGGAGRGHNLKLSELQWSRTDCFLEGQWQENEYLRNIDGMQEWTCWFLEV